MTCDGRRFGKWLASVALAASACGSPNGSDGGGLADVSKDSSGDAMDSGSDVDGGQVADGSLDATATDAGLDSGSPDVSVDVAKTDSGPKLGCGDGLCTSPETLTSCPADCNNPVCGDGFCQKPESGMTCEIDCAPQAIGELACLKKLCPTAVFGCSQDVTCAHLLGTALVCASTADPAFCAQNLANNPKSKALTDAACGFATCAGQADGAICGDGLCQPSESSVSCAYDCVGIAGKCGDGICAGSETSSSCPADCTGGPVCGNGKCESGEDSNNCVADCPYVAVCGDGICAATENASSCALDCNPALKAKVDCLKSECGGEFDACTPDPACVKGITAGLECAAKCASGDIVCLLGCNSSLGGNTQANALASCSASKCP